MTNAVNPPFNSPLDGIRSAFFENWDQPHLVLARRTADVDRIVHQAFELAAVHEDLAAAIGNMEAVRMAALITAFGIIGHDIGFGQRDVLAELGQNTQAG